LIATDMVGTEPERLTLKQQIALAGKWTAMEVYGPDTQPARRIAAVGDSVADCVLQLTAKGLDPAKFEFRPMRRPI
jgi:hypothetical protein